MGDLTKILAIIEAIKILLPLIIELLNMISDADKKKEAENLVAKTISNALSSVIT